jgi:dynein heavy chain
VRILVSRRAQFCQDKTRSFCCLMSQNWGKRNRLPVVLEPMVVADRHAQVLENQEITVPAVAPSADKQKRGVFSVTLKEDNQDSIPMILDDISLPLPEIGKSYKYKHTLPVAKSFKLEIAKAIQQPVLNITNSKTIEYQKRSVIEPIINYRKALEPKVMLPFETRIDETPRKIDIERKKRQYSSNDIGELVEKELGKLKDRGLLAQNSHHFRISKKLGIDLLKEDAAADNSKDQINTDISHVLPLEIFDNTEFDCRTPDDWLNMGSIPDMEIHNHVKVEKICKPGYEHIRFAAVPLPGKAYDSLEWRDCLVIAYNEVSKQWKIKWRSYNGWELDKKLDTNQRFIHPEDEGLIEEFEGLDVNPNDVIDGKELWVHRIDLMFLAENPENVAKRIAYAYQSRYQMSLQLKYNFYIDCMPLDESTQTLGNDKLGSIMKRAIGSDKIYQKIYYSGRADEIIKELHNDYMRTMNKMIFDKEIDDNFNAAKYNMVSLATSEPTKDIPL